MAIIGGNIVVAHIKDKNGWRIACPFCGFGEEKIQGKEQAHAN